MTAKVIAVANQKGGVGKTTTAVTLASGLAFSKYKTLIIDLDVQGHVAKAFNLNKGNGLYHWIVKSEPLENIIVSPQPDLDILTGGKETLDVVQFIEKISFQRERYLRDKFAELQYDVIIMDAAPNFSMLQINAFTASDIVIIPTKLSTFDSDGLSETIKTLTEVAKAGYSLQRFGILATFFDRTTQETRTQFTQLVEKYGDKVWPPIPQDTNVRVAQAYAKTLWEFCPKSPAVIGFQDIESNARYGGYADLLKRIVGYVRE